MARTTHALGGFEMPAARFNRANRVCSAPCGDAIVAGVGDRSAPSGVPGRRAAAGDTVSVPGTRITPEDGRLATCHDADGNQAGRPSEG